MNCYICGIPIDGDERYGLSPAGESIHAEKCHAVTWEFRR